MRRYSRVVVLVGGPRGDADRVVRFRRHSRAAVPVVDLACVSSFQFDFSPPLSFNTVSSQTTAALTGCVSPNSRYPDLLSAVLFADRGHSTATGCSPVPVTVVGVGSILWNDDTSSVFDFHVSTNPLSDAFGFTADIRSGTLGRRPDHGAARGRLPGWLLPARRGQQPEREPRLGYLHAHGPRAPLQGTRAAARSSTKGR